jgi:glycosyltransferase involved in cell wall biosynthesis
MKSSLKLALVTRRYPPLIGGAERVFSYLAAALAQQGADVTVLTSQIPGSKLTSTSAGSPDRLIDRLPSVETVGDRLRVERLATSGLRFWGTWRYMRNLARWFAQNTIDLVYVSMLKHDAYAVLGAAKQQHFPVVLRPEGAGATGDVAWQRWGRFGRWIGHRCRRAAAFVALSPAIETEVRTAWQTGTLARSVLDQVLGAQRTEPRIVAIPNGVPVPEVAWQSRRGWSGVPCAVFVGRLASEKGLNTLVDAWPLVCAKFPGAQLMLVGEGPERPSLEGRAQKHGLSLGEHGAINFRGPVGDPTGLLRRADVFILPSREEGMSVALLEAMALGMPVLASSIPGNLQLIRDGEHGYLFSPNDPIRLARAINELWADPAQAASLGRAARKRVELEFSIDAIACRHLELFRQILECRK